MTIRIVRLGERRSPNEGVRIGKVRRPPRGVPKSDHAKHNFYDVWLPNLAPSEALLKLAVSPDELLGGLLLRGRSALPPLGVAALLVERGGAVA